MKGETMRKAFFLSVVVVLGIAWTAAFAWGIGPGEQRVRPLAVHYRPLPVTIGHLSSARTDQPVTVAYRPVGVRRAGGP